jgi:hypothetical protein
MNTRGARKIMPIDNFLEAQDLCERLKETLPFRVRAGFQLRNTMKENGIQVDAETWFVADSILYTGDMGGINCGLVAENENKIISSITHVKIDPEHPLAAEVRDYQQRRIERLKRSEQGDRRKPKAGRKQKKR